MRTKLCSLAMAVLFLAAIPALAQAPAGPPSPSPELAKLDFFLGTWSCKGRAEASPMGPAHATAGTVKVSKEIGGFWYAGHYAEKKTSENPHPVTFHFLQGYDPTAKTFTQDCFDSFGGHCHQTSPGWQGDNLVFTGEASGGGGPATPVRDTFARKGAASLEHTGEMQADGKWVPTDHETCTKGGK